MTPTIDFEKVTTVLLQHGEWYEVDPGRRDGGRFCHRTS